jgi:putative restriction endonuclease
MSLSDITDASAIRGAIAEFDSLGRDAFLQKYGFRRARQYFLSTSDGKLYDSKAIVGVAHGIQFPTQGPLRAEDFSGGEQTVKALLEQLGFTVSDPESSSDPAGGDSSEENAPRTPRVWIEKTLSRGRQDRQTGPHRIGQALWSPQKAADGRDVYANMRDVRPGDTVLHLTDNDAFTGISWVAEGVDTPR